MDAAILLLRDALKTQLPHIEWRGIIVAPEYIQKDTDDIWRKELEEPIDHTPGDPPTLPYACLIFLPDDEAPAWTKPLWEKLKNRLPQTHLIWVVMADPNSDKSLRQRFHQPTNNSLLINLESPKGFPVFGPDTTLEEVVLTMSANSPENYWDYLIHRLKEIIG